MSAISWCHCYDRNVTNWGYNARALFSEPSIIHRVTPLWETLTPNHTLTHARSQSCITGVDTTDESGKAVHPFSKGTACSQTSSVSHPISIHVRSPSTGPHIFHPAPPPTSSPLSSSLSYSHLGWPGIIDIISAGHLRLLKCICRIFQLQYSALKLCFLVTFSFPSFTQTALHVWHQQRVTLPI